MPNLDRLSSFSKKLKETKVVVQAGGGQDGTAEDGSNETSVQRSSDAGASVTSSGQPQSVVGATSAIVPTSPEAVAVLAEIRDAVKELTREISAIRRDGLPGSGGGGEAVGILGQQVGELRDHLQTQGVQLAEVLRLLRAFN